jgi:uncharacterized membrane protein
MFGYNVESIAIVVFILFLVGFIVGLFLIGLSIYFYFKMPQHYKGDK